MAKKRQEDPGPSKDVMSVKLSVVARETIERLVDDYGTQKLLLVQKLLTWFASQPRSVQHIILTPIPTEMVGGYADALEAMAAQLRQSASAASATGPPGAATADRASPGTPDPRGSIPTGQPGDGAPLNLTVTIPGKGRKPKGP